MTAQDLYLNTPLYTKILISDFTELKSLVRSFSIVEFDGYNPIDKIDTTFTTFQSFNIDISFDKSAMCEMPLKCLRTNRMFYFYFKWDSINKQLTKVGQDPSLADFHISQIKQYDKILKPQQLREFTKGIGLAANGVGIGSFVYLRRIFESLITESEEEMKLAGSFNEETYNKYRMAERIMYLKHYLPEFLVEHKELYGILSVGVHELTEEDCLKYFDAVKVGIEFILDEKLEKHLKAQKIAAASAKIKSTSNAINSTSKS